MQTPIFIDEGNGDLELYPTVNAVEEDLEAIDVKAGIYDAFDSTGRVLKLTTYFDAEGCELVQIQPTDEVAQDDLRSRLLRTLKAINRLDRDSDLSFDELRNICMTERLLHFFG